jgi:hypothetical protein
MGNSGKVAIGAALAAVGMLVLTAVTLEEPVMFTFLGLVAVAYVAAVTEVFARRRYLAVVAAGAGTSMSLGFSIAFLRMWGLAFNQDAAALGTAVTSKDSDIYFYLAAASAMATLMVLFLGVVWPAGKRLRPSRQKSASRRPPSAVRRPAARTGAKGAGTRQPANSQRSNPQGSPAQRLSGSRNPAARAPAAAAKRPASSASTAGRTTSASKPAARPAPKPGSKTASRR